jgi:NAD(P)-dependent dehydrogenase (short-subunit alcohol dehydrogenase family)
MSVRTEGNDFRFDGRVAVVTGAGGPSPKLGETYAKYLAAHGAKVVVNDFGLGPDGRGGLPAPAEQTVQAIIDAGGEAVADSHSVAESGSARQVIQTALDTWGRVDILINNAGTFALEPFDEVTDADAAMMVTTHFFGTIWMCRAAWPHMKRAGYGRIVNISSNGMFTGGATIYGAAKGGNVALAQNLVQEGRQAGINVNVVAPNAATRKHVFLLHKEPEEIFHDAAPRVEQVAPVVAYLCHEDCEVTGRHIHAIGGQVSEYYWSETQGYSNPNPTMADVHDNLQRVFDRTDATDPRF